MKPSILFFGKKDDRCCELAADYIRRHFSEHVICLGTRGQAFPQEAGQWQGDYVISYLSQWIIPEAILDCATKAGINFHPGNTFYPGIGCTNFAVYREEKTFGITCHHMNPKVDSGQVIVEKNFEVYETDTVYSLTQRCYAHILSVFFDIMEIILKGHELPVSTAIWQRKPFTRKELNELCVLTLDMPEDEIKRRVKAVTYPNAPGAYFMIDGIRYDVRQAAGMKFGIKDRS